MPHPNMNLRPRKSPNTPSPYINKSKTFKTCNKKQVQHKPLITDQQLIQQLIQANKAQAQQISNMKREQELRYKQHQLFLQEFDLYTEVQKDSEKKLKKSIHELKKKISHLTNQAIEHNKIIHFLNAKHIHTLPSTYPKNHTQPIINIEPIYFDDEENPFSSWQQS
jgi:hypothetical protein